MRKVYCVHDYKIIEIDRDADYCKSLGGSIKVTWDWYGLKKRTTCFHLNHNCFFDYKKAEEKLKSKLKADFSFKIRRLMFLRETMEDISKNGVEVKVIIDGVLS